MLSNDLPPPYPYGFLPRVSNRIQIGSLRFLAGLALNIVGGVAVLFAVLILVGAVLIYRGTEMAGGVIVIVFSVLSIFVGSGWLIGLILALVGGILALLKK